MKRLIAALTVALATLSGTAAADDWRTAINESLAAAQERTAAGESLPASERFTPYHLRDDWAASWPQKVGLPTESAQDIRRQAEAQRAADRAERVQRIADGYQRSWADSPLIDGELDRETAERWADDTIRRAERPNNDLQRQINALEWEIEQLKRER